MDPNANLAEQLRLAETLFEGINNAGGWDGDGETSDALKDANRLCELVVALDEWLRKGGFLPDTWENRPGRDLEAMSAFLLACQGALVGQREQNIRLATRLLMEHKAEEALGQ